MHAIVHLFSTVCLLLISAHATRQLRSQSAELLVISEICVSNVLFVFKL